jgi:predicted nucleic-acid-binding protein
MIGIDTNVLIRYLVEDDPKQTELARIFLSRMCTADDPGFINHVVLCEVTWLLGRGYRYGRTRIAEVIRGLLTAAELVTQDRDLVWAALKDFEGGTADFPDYLIARLNLASGCRYTVTFDRKAAKHDFFRLLVNVDSKGEAS